MTESYYDKLYTFCCNQGIRVVDNPNDEGSELHKGEPYFISFPEDSLAGIINLNGIDASLIKNIVAFAHEIGHAVSMINDMIDVKRANECILIHRAYNNIESKQTSEYNIYIELIAWYFAEDLLDKVGFNDWAIFNKCFLLNAGSYINKYI